jgi:hypothetical protein
MEEMVGCMNSQSKYESEWGSQKEWQVNPHNDGFSPIKLHLPRLTHGSLGMLFLSTWSSFLSRKELRIIGVISQTIVF